MTVLKPLETLYDVEHGSDLPLPHELKALYGRLQFPRQAGRPYVVGNFVATLDGVVSLSVPGMSGGGPISGFNQHDRMVMGILRAVADAVIIGAGTVRAVSPEHVWNAPYIYPPLADVYQQLRVRLGKPEPPLNVIVTAGGELDLNLHVFQAGEVPVLIVTTSQGARRITERGAPASVQVTAVLDGGPISAAAILRAVAAARTCNVILTEGGPQLMGNFFAEQCLDELFLTVAPQVAGRDGLGERPGVVAGRSFAPTDPVWGTLVGVKRAESHLFLRYAFPHRGIIAD